MELMFEGGKMGFVSLSMPLQDFGKYLLQGLNSDPTTRSVEQTAQQLILGGFNGADAEHFVKAVCRWGNYAGVGGRVLKNNMLADVVVALSDAYAATCSDKIDVALGHLLKLKCLAVSFASKHLKFLDPTKHVVLDSVISARLGYPLTVSGYCRFVDDCHAILKRLQDDGIPTTSTAYPIWRLADVEMAIFQKLKD